MTQIPINFDDVFKREVVNVTESTKTHQRGHPRTRIPPPGLVDRVLTFVDTSIAEPSPTNREYPIQLSNLTSPHHEPLLQARSLLKMAEERGIDELTDITEQSPYIHFINNSEGGVLWVSPPRRVEITHDVEKYLANLGTYIEPETERGKAILVTIATFSDDLRVRKKGGVAYISVIGDQKYAGIPDDIIPQYGHNVPEFIKALTTRKDVSELMELSERNGFIHVEIKGNVAHVDIDGYSAIAVHRTDNFTIAYLLNQGYRQQVGRVDPIGEGPHFLGRANPEKRKQDTELFFTLGLLDPHLRVLNKEGIAYLCANKRTAKELMNK